uniref:Putative ovule protein n=1 Tax=Solanum chacoense TaxID=4108 RepID=A0A0V0IB56_SOLCH
MVDLQAEANSSSSHLHANPTSVRIDFASPFYLHPSESAGSSLLPALTDPGFLQWERCDDMVTSWILNSLSPDLRDSL